MRLIDADALAYEILSEYGADSGTEDVNTIYGMVINAPTIDAEPVKHGKWEKTKVAGGKIYVCSECSEAIYKSTFEENVHYYCNNCGAKMDKGGERR